MAVFIPFKVQEIQDKGGIYFGENAISHNLIMCNKANLLNQSAFLLGVPGAGKSFSAKELIAFLMLHPDYANDDILICDPEGEFGALVKALGREKATVAHLVAGGKDRLNAMYMVEGYGEQIRARCSQLADTVEGKVRQTKVMVSTAKENLISSAKQMVQTFREKGRSALCHAAQALHIPSVLSRMGRGFKKAAPEQLRDIEIAGHKLYSVTDERIRAVPKPFFQGVSNKVNGLAQEYARGVLKKVQGLEVGTEAVVNFTKDGKCTGYYVGGQNSMKVKPPEIQVPYYSLHNHPSNGILSPEDIQQLIKRPQMQGIGAVGNAGALFTCEKVFGYSQKNAEGWFKALKKKYPLYKGESGKIEDALAQRIAFAEELRRDGAKYGLIFSR